VKNHKEPPHPCTIKGQHVKNCKEAPIHVTSKEEHVKNHKEPPQKFTIEGEHVKNCKEAPCPCNK